MKTIKRFLSELRLYINNNIISFIPSHHLRIFFYKNFMKFEVGQNSRIFMHCNFDSTNNIQIGNNTIINPKCRIDNRGNIKIGSNVGISQEVVILTADHDMNIPEFTGRIRPVIIEDYAWIGTRATILPGTTIGRGAVVAAGAVVTKDVEAFSVVGGIPAKKIGTRPETINYTLFYNRLFQ